MRGRVANMIAVTFGAVGIVRWRAKPGQLGKHTVDELLRYSRPSAVAGGIDSRSLRFERPIAGESITRR